MAREYWLKRDGAVAAGRASGDKILFQLKMHGSATAGELAERLGISPQAVRERLDWLRDEGLVGFVDEVAGRGQPKRVWHLTENASSCVPETHGELVVELIDAIRRSLGETALDRLVALRERDTEARYRSRLAACDTLAEKVEALARMRSEEGYMAECVPEPESGGLLLVENHCPICAAARACQGFCRAELEIFRRVLGPECTVERVEHVMTGARRCAYRIAPARG